MEFLEYYGAWILGGLGLLAVVFGLYELVTMWRDDDEL